jgi:hypothetical protein
VNVILKRLWQETSQKDEFKLEDLKLRNNVGTHFDRHRDSPQKAVVINFPSPAVRSPRTETQHWKLYNTTQHNKQTTQRAMASSNELNIVATETTRQALTAEAKSAKESS